MTRYDVANLVAFVYFETRYGSLDEIAGVAWAVVNRSFRCGKTIAQVVSSYKYASLKEFKRLVNDYVANNQISDRYFKQCDWIVQGILKKQIIDPTKGAVSFIKRLDFVNSSASIQPTAFIGDYVFTEDLC